MTEEWKDIEGYEGLYQVSNLGRVRSLDRQIKYSFGGMKLERGRIMRQCIARNGYARIRLRKEGDSEGFSVHRLVAEAFIPNPDNLPQVNHRDENKLNNRTDNLEWCTRTYNNHYGTCVERMRHAFAEKGKTIEQLSENGEVMATFAHVSEASRETGIARSTIRDCCTGRNNRKSAGGYRWRYKKE